MGTWEAHIYAYIYDKYILTTLKKLKTDNIVMNTLIDHVLDIKSSTVLLKKIDWKGDQDSGVGRP